MFTVSTPCLRTPQKAKSAASTDNAWTPGRGRNPDACIFKDQAFHLSSGFFFLSPAAFISTVPTGTAAMVNSRPNFNGEKILLTPKQSGSSEYCAWITTFALMVDPNIVGSLGCFNAHSAHAVSAIFITVGEDPAQNIHNSPRIATMEAINGGKDLNVSGTMPAIEVLGRSLADKESLSLMVVMLLVVNLMCVTGFSHASSLTAITPVSSNALPSFRMRLQASDVRRMEKKSSDKEAGTEYVKSAIHLIPVAKTSMKRITNTDVEGNVRVNHSLQRSNARCTGTGVNVRRRNVVDRSHSNRVSVDSEIDRSCKSNTYHLDEYGNVRFSLRL
ncbi:hydroxymethylglutaryl-CoA reductase, class I/II [Tanacetum coccineum]